MENFEVESRTIAGVKYAIIKSDKFELALPFKQAMALADNLWNTVGEASSDQFEKILE